MPIPLLVVYLVSGTGANVFSKLTSNALRVASRAEYSLFMTVNGAAACLFFWVSGGFSVCVNLPTLIFGAVYAAFIALTLVLGMILYHRMSVSGVNILKNGCSLLCTSFSGAVLFSEKLSGKTWIQLFAALLSLILILLEQRRNEPSVKREIKRSSAVSLAILLGLLVLTSSANTVIIKYYTLHPAVADENSFFFLTNVFLVLGCLAFLMWDTVRQRGAWKNAVKILRPRPLMSIMGNVLFSNVGSLVGIRILAQMDVSVYTPIMSSIGILAGFFGSLLFREKLGVFSCLAIIAALFAVIV